MWSFYLTSAGTILPGPGLVSPSNGSTVTSPRPTLSWQAVPGVWGFRYGVQILPQMRGYIFSNWWDGTQTDYTFGGDLEVGHQYEWWVQLRNSYTWGSESAHWRFTIGTNTYSISGRVTDVNGKGVSGVALSDGMGHTATTDGNGNYTLAGLFQGTWTITPSKAGFTFSPASQTSSSLQCHWR